MCEPPFNHMVAQRGYGGYLKLEEDLFRMFAALKVIEASNKMAADNF